MSYDTDVLSFGPTDAQWLLVEPMIPDAVPGGRPRSVLMRQVINAILYINRTGCAWRMLPKDFGPWSSVYHYFRTFRDDGAWQYIHNKLREQVRRKAGKKPTPSAAILDSQSVKTDAPSKTIVTAIPGATRARKHLIESVS